MTMMMILISDNDVNYDDNPLIWGLGVT
jgi:hypothetical protein